MSAILSARGRGASDAARSAGCARAPLRTGVALLVAAALLATASANEPSPTNPCGLPDGELNRSIKQFDDDLPACMIVRMVETNATGNATELTNSTFRMLYPVVIDQFSLLEASNSSVHFSSLTNRFSKTLAVTVQIQVGRFFTPPVPYNWNGTFEPNVTFVAPFYTVLVEVRSGAIAGVRWDNGCSACDGDECFSDVCGVPEATCSRVGSAATDTDCNFKVYIGWFGTDRNGHYMTSAGLRINQFRKFSIRTATRNAARTTDESTPSLP
jgi:hypothetical protein